MGLFQRSLTAMVIVLGWILIYWNWAISREVGEGGGGVRENPFYDGGRYGCFLELHNTLGLFVRFGNFDRITWQGTKLFN